MAEADTGERRARLQRRRERYLEAYADEHMTRDELRDAMAKLDAELVRLDGADAATRRPDPLADPGRRRAMLREVGAIRRAWASARPEAKRRIVGHLATAARMAAGQAVSFVWRTTEELADRT